MVIWVGSDVFPLVGCAFHGCFHGVLWLWPPMACYQSCYFPALYTGMCVCVYLYVAYSVALFFLIFDFDFISVFFSFLFLVPEKFRRWVPVFSGYLGAVIFFFQFIILLLLVN